MIFFSFSLLTCKRLQNLLFAILLYWRKSNTRAKVLIVTIILHVTLQPFCIVLTFRRLVISMQRWKFDFKFHIMSKAYQRKCSFIRTKNISESFNCTNINKVSNYILYLASVCDSVILPELNRLLRCGIYSNPIMYRQDIHFISQNEL